VRSQEENLTQPRWGNCCPVPTRLKSMESSLPVIDIDLFLKVGSGSKDALEESKKAADALIRFGALIVRDSRVSEEDNEAFLDLMEDYFAQPTEIVKRDERPEYGYQVGVTLENTEKPKCAVDEPCLAIIEKLDPSERPLDISGHQPDPKCRFFWKMNQEKPPYPTEFPQLNMPNVVPEHFNDVWVERLEKWGNMMKDAVESVAEMIALGLGLNKEAFRDAGRYGPHLLAPTASDLNKYGRNDTILAGFHTDLNFLTIHGRSRYPGLNIWARNTGKRIPVRFPDRSQGRFLLVQAGKQLEHITGGVIRAGYHEVVVNQQTLEAIHRRTISHPERPSIRISSTFFWHLSSDYELKPIDTNASLVARLENAGAESDLGSSNYPSMKVGHQVQQELRHIALMA